MVLLGCLVQLVTMNMGEFVVSFYFTISSAFFLHTNMKILTFTFFFNKSPIAEWKVDLITNMHQMFRFWDSRKSCNPNIERWDVSNVTNFVSSWYILLLLFCCWFVKLLYSHYMTQKYGMFWDSQINRPLNRWNMSSATNLVSQATRRVNDHHVLSCTWSHWSNMLHTICMSVHW